jgi:hypothetical protein
MGVRANWGLSAMSATSHLRGQAHGVPSLALDAEDRVFAAEVAGEAPFWQCRADSGVTRLN